MGTTQRVVEPLGPYHEIVEAGGTVSYGLEMLFYLRSLPKEESDRIVADIESQNRVRRFIRLRSDAPRWLRLTPEYDAVFE